MSAVPAQEPTERIPFNRVDLTGRERRYLATAMSSGYLAGDGDFSRRCRQLLEWEVGCVRAFLTPSCTAALEAAALILDIGPEDEVIVPAFTFVSTVNAFALRGARPVFCDIRPDTLNLDERLVERLITKRTKAILPVHYAGVACEMDTLCQLAGQAGVAVVEDNAHGLFGTYRGRPLGSFGALATQSFHETKNYTCGEGGALLINAEDLCEKAEIVREKGTDRSRFFRGQVDKYTWVGLGSSYLASELQAAFLLAQLEARELVQGERRTIWEHYRSGLGEWAAANNVELPTVPEHCQPAYHLFHILLPNLDARDRLIQHLAGHAIQSVFHYQPLHISQMGARYGGRPGDCPVTEDVADRLVRLPFFRSLAGEPQDRVIETIQAFSCR